MDLAIDGLTETLRSVQGLSTDLRKVANGELRDAANVCAEGLVDKLRRAAGASGVPVAPRVASSLRIKRDRLPAVALGGSKRVGATGAPAGRLLWGSEHGPAGAVNHFAVEANPAGYWIAPTVKRFREDDALTNYRAAVLAILRKWGLL